MALHNRLHYRGNANGIPSYETTRISGAVADTAVSAVPGVVGYVHITTVGAASSLISVYDGATSGTAFAEIVGTSLGSYPLHAYCGTSIHVKTVDSGGTLEVTVCWL